MIPLTGIERSFTLTDFWRWWVVHLWVEQSFEFFASSMSAYLLMAVGLVSRKLAERAVYFQLILIFLGGVIGTGHHLYWAGGPSMWVPMGSMFSFIEVLPLVLLIIEAIGQYQTLNHAHTALFGAFGLLGSAWFISACATPPQNAYGSTSGSGSGLSGYTMLAWYGGSCSTSSRSAGHS
jgi:nitric oxide reductase large subunit